jgi:hypothetical protein
LLAWGPYRAEERVLVQRRKQALLAKGQQAKLEHFLCLAYDYTHPQGTIS